MTTDLVLTNAEKHLTLYKGMCRAIGACHRVDECKDIADKSIALAAYYKQIKDDETVRKFNEVKLRAWRRIGKLFAAVDLSERETWVAKYKTIRAAFDGAAIAGIDDNRIREILTLMTISDYDFEYALGQSAAGSIASLLQYSPEYQEMLREMQRKEQARTRMTNEELLDIDELMQRATNQARQFRAYALWDAAKLERQQGNRELADRLKSAGNRLVQKNFQANNPPERKLAALTAMAETPRERSLHAHPLEIADFRTAPSTPWSPVVSMLPNGCCSSPEAELKRIPGIGPASMAEIRRYRGRFLLTPAGGSPDG